MSYLRVYSETLHACLVEAQKDRHLMPMGFHNNDVTPYWNHWEMLTMMKEVNRWRGMLEKPFVTWQDIYEAERKASGHVDYTRSFALYCAELVLS